MLHALAIRARCISRVQRPVWIALIILLLTGASSAGPPIDFQLTLLSGGINDACTPALVDGDNVVWVGRQAGIVDVYHYHIPTGVRTNLTSDAASQDNIMIQGNHVVWWGSGIYLHDLPTHSTTTITTEPRSLTPRISGNNLVWLEGRPEDTQYRMMHYNLATMSSQQIGGFADRHILQISGSDVVWESRLGSAPTTQEIFHYNLQSGITTRLTTNSVSDGFPRLSDGNVVWQTFDTENTAEIFRRNLQTGITQQLTNNLISDRNVEISGNNVVWQSTATTGNIVHYNLTTSIATQLTHGLVDPESYGVPKVNGSSLVWYGRDSGAIPNEIYFHNLADGTTSRVTNNLFRDELPEVSGTSVVFRRERTENSNLWDVYLATPVPEPAAAVVGCAGTVILLGAAIRRRRSRPDATS